MAAKFTDAQLADIEILADMGCGVDDLAARHLVEEIRALREALAPFADMNADFPLSIHDDEFLPWGGGLRVWNVRRAAKALGMEED